MLELAAAELWTVFHEAGETDFVEVAARARQALGSDAAPTDLALALDYRIRHLLVDEFQDTSPTQVDLLRRLTAGWSPDDGRTCSWSATRCSRSTASARPTSGCSCASASAASATCRSSSCGCIATTALPGRGRLGECGFPGVFPARRQPGRRHPLRRIGGTRPAREDSGVDVHPRGGARRAAMRAGDEAGASSTSSASPRRGAGRRIAVLVRARNHLDALVAEIRRSGPELRFQAVEIERLAGRQLCRICWR